MSEALLSEDEEAKRKEETSLFFWDMKTADLGVCTPDMFRTLKGISERKSK